MSIILKTTNLCKSFSRQTVVNNISLNIEKNSVYGLLGPNGAGKSTTLKMITGILKPTSGSIEFDGHAWRRKDLNDIGTLIETPPLYENLTAFENIERLKLVEREKTKEELLALQYQMNPHFLLNSLNSIRWMAMMTNNKIVADTLVTLGKIITPMLRNPSLTWKIENEIEFLDNYVAMMQLRFGHDMEYSMNCSKEWYDLVFPRLILQPLIENCFVHGSSSEEIRTINVIIECNERIEVKVINSGVFFDEIQLKEIYMKMKTFSKASDHIGMANVYKRLNLLYGDQGSMRVESNRKLGFIVEVSFPKSTKM